MFVKGFKNFSSMIKQASKKNYEKFYKLLSKQEIRVLQAFKEKQVQKQASKEKFWKLLKQEKLLENNCKKGVLHFETFSGKAKPFIKAYTH